MQLEWKTSVQHVMIWVINNGKERRGTMTVRNERRRETRREIYNREQGGKSTIVSDYMDYT